jgi:hypothetical protein
MQWISSGTSFHPITASNPYSTHPPTIVVSTTPATPQAVVTGTQPVETGSPSVVASVTTQQRQSQYFSSQRPVVTLGQSRFTVDPSSNLVIGGQTLRPSQQITWSGTVISRASNGGAIIIDGTTQPLDPALGFGTQGKLITKLICYSFRWYQSWESFASCHASSSLPPDLTFQSSGEP